MAAVVTFGKRTIHYIRKNGYINEQIFYQTYDVISHRVQKALSDSFWIYRRYINKSIYLSIYLQCY